MKQSVLFLLVLVLCISSATHAQRSQKIRTSGTKVQVEELADSTLVFLFDGLKPALITFTDGTTTDSRMNYSILLDQFEMETRRGIAALNPYDVVKLELEGLTFIQVPGEGFVEVVKQGKFPLYLKRQIKVSTMPVRRGAYGGTDHTSAIDVASNISTQSTGDFDRQIFLDNPSGQEMDITLRYNEYFLIEKDDLLVKINNQRQLLRDFPEFGSELREFTRRENTDFSNPDDLTKLVEYMESL